MSRPDGKSIIGWCLCSSQQMTLTDLWPLTQRHDEPSPICPRAKKRFSIWFRLLLTRLHLFTSYSPPHILLFTTSSHPIHLLTFFSTPLTSSYPPLHNLLTFASTLLLTSSLQLLQRAVNVCSKRTGGQTHIQLFLCGAAVSCRRASTYCCSCCEPTLRFGSLLVQTQSHQALFAGR